MRIGVETYSIAEDGPGGPDRRAAVRRALDLLGREAHDVHRLGPEDVESPTAPAIERTHILERHIRDNPLGLDILVIADPLGLPVGVPREGGRPRVVGLMVDWRPLIDRGPPGTEPISPRVSLGIDLARRFDGWLVDDEAEAGRLADRLSLPANRVIPIAGRSPWTERLTPREGRVKPPSRPRRASPRLAFVSPLPPQRSGVADYSVSLLRELARDYRIDLFHDGHYRPDLSWDLRAFDTFTLRDFPRTFAARDYRAVLHQMGNSIYHGGIYRLMSRFPGITTLHDYGLANLHACIGRADGRTFEHLNEELGHDCPDLTGAVLDDYAKSADLDAFVTSCARSGAYMNRRVFEDSLAVVVHSAWCRDVTRRRLPDLEGKTHLVPLGASPRVISEADRRSIRGRLGIAPETAIVAAFGFVHPDKMNVEAIGAFEAIREHLPADSLLVFAGQEADGGASLRRAAASPCRDRIRFLGRLDAPAFDDWLAIADVGIALRRPPTNGESSAALLQLLGSGVATIVTDVGSFADYPDDVLRKVRWDGDGPGRLAAALRELIGDAQARRALGESARRHVAEHHDWPKVAARYIEVIESVRAEGRARVA